MSKYICQRRLVSTDLFRDQPLAQSQSALQGTKQTWHPQSARWRPPQGRSRRSKCKDSTGASPRAVRFSISVRTSQSFIAAIDASISADKSVRSRVSRSVHRGDLDRAVTGLSGVLGRDEPELLSLFPSRRRQSQIVPVTSVRRMRQHRQHLLSAWRIRAAVGESGDP
jgi:hypothetical protein